MIKNIFSVSDGNKNFMRSMVESLVSLDRDAFVELFRQAADPGFTNYGHLQKADLLFAVLYDLAINDQWSGIINSDNAEILLDTVLAQPELNNRQKIMSMMVLGAALGPTTFDMLFGEDAPLKPSDVSEDEVDENRREFFKQCHVKLLRAFSCGVKYSQDINIFNTKYAVMKSILKHLGDDKELIASFNHPDSNVLKFKLPADLFKAVFQSLSADERAGFVCHAPAELFASPYLYELLDQHLLPPEEHLLTAAFQAFKDENQDAFVLLLAEYLRGDDAMEMGVFTAEFKESMANPEYSSEAHKSMRTALKDEVKNQRICAIKHAIATPSTRDIEFGVHVRSVEFLHDSFLFGRVDEFNLVLESMGESYRPSTRRLLHEALFEVKHATHLLVKAQAFTEQHKHMFNTLNAQYERASYKTIDHLTVCEPLQEHVLQEKLKSVLNRDDRFHWGDSQAAREDFFLDESLNHDRRRGFPHPMDFDGFDR